MTKINKMTKMLVSMLLVSLAVLAPVSALSTSADSTSTLINAGVISVVL